MKTIFSVLLLLLVAAGAAQTENKIDLAGNGLKGPVKSTSFTVYYTKEKFGELEKDGVRFKREDEFNKAGLLTYTKEVLRSITTRYYYKYDGHGKLTERISDDGEEKLVTKMKYNDDGTLAEIDVYDGKGKLESRQKNKYSGKQLISSAHYQGNGDLKETELFQHKGDKLIAAEKYDPKGKLQSFIEYTHNSTGQVVTELSVESNSKGDVFSFTHKYTYDKQGRVISDERTNHEKYQTVVRREYDAVGNLVKEFTDAENSVEYLYKYDKHNNWIEEVEIKTSPGSVRKYLTVREIKYY